MLRIYVLISFLINEYFHKNVREKTFFFSKSGAQKCQPKQKRNTHVIAISTHKKMGNLSSLEHTSANQQKTPQK